MPIPDPARIRPFDSPYAIYDWLGEIMINRSWG